MKKIVIIGAGQLGSRHLQSLNLINQELEITVVDPSLSSLETARSRFEATIKDTKHQISYQQDINLGGTIDVIIVASTAQSRRAIVERIFNGKTPVNHLVLEKLLFTQEQDYYDIADLLAKQQTKTWVNCTMRMMPYYQNLGKLFDQQAVQYRVSGSQYGLVTNAIHYLDHLAYITGTSNFELDTRYLDQQIIESKRAGYYEVTGTLIAQFANGSTASLHCDKAGMAPTQIEIFSNEHRIISREWEQRAWQTSLADDWKWQEVEAGIPFQSSLTAELVNSLLEKDQCALTDYQTSMHIHLQLLNPLKAFLADCGFHSDLCYPFT